MRQPARKNSQAKKTADAGLASSRRLKQQATNRQLLCLGFYRQQATLPPPLMQSPTALAIESVPQPSNCYRRRLKTSWTGIPRAKLRPKDARAALHVDARLLIPIWSQAYEKACERVKPIKEAVNARYFIPLWKEPGAQHRKSQRVRCAALDLPGARSRPAKDQVRTCQGARFLS